MSYLGESQRKSNLSFMTENERALLRSNNQSMYTTNSAIGPGQGVGVGQTR